MKKTLLLMFLLSTQCLYAQTYIPMPADSAVWRYRFYDVDFITQVVDQVLLLKGDDTVHSGKTFHKVYSRFHRIVQDNSAPPPPFVDVEADYPDMYYGGFREEDKKVYWLNSLGDEHLIFDYNATIGSSVPAYYGTATIISIDSILLFDGYHKRFNTDLSFFAPIEGIGSSAGLWPPLIDGSDNNRFYCYTRGAVSYRPPSAATTPCTYVTPLSFDDGVNNIVGNNLNFIDVAIVPNPTSGNAYVLVKDVNNVSARMSVMDITGKVVYSASKDISGNKAQIEIPQSAIAVKGIYLVQTVTGNQSNTQKLVVY